MNETIDVTSSFTEVFEGRDNDRLEVYMQHDRDRSDALHLIRLDKLSTMG
jgi:hypothetical protein